MEADFDLIVIGSGPGGEGAAMQAAKLGKSVAVVERFHNLGGGCTHWGTIPSKSLRHAIAQMTEANNNPLFRSAGVSLSLSFPDLRRAARSVIDRQVEMKIGYFERNQIELVTGHARFIDAHTVEAEQASGAGAGCAAAASSWPSVRVPIDPTTSISSIRASSTATRFSTSITRRYR